jgi:hypothetical protein
VLWIKYDALSSVFLIKNLYNILHNASQIERYLGARNYSKASGSKKLLFTEFVHPRDWYGLNTQQWRDATRSTLVLQAQSGRGV